MTDAIRRKGALRGIALFTIAALVLGVVGSWVIAAASNSNSDGDVWVLQAQTADLSTDKIVLNNVGDSVIQVLIEDGSQVDSASISQLVQDWSNEFGDQPPRAVLAGAVDGTSRSVMVNLGTPTATADSITFEGSSVESGSVDPTEFSEATLLIDNNGLLEAELGDGVQA